MGGAQLYQYRLVLAAEDKQLNVGTDMDLNVEIDFRSMLSTKVALKASAIVRSSLFENEVTTKML